MCFVKGKSERSFLNRCPNRPKWQRAQKRRKLEIFYLTAENLFVCPYNLKIIYIVSIVEPSTLVTNFKWLWAGALECEYTQTKTSSSKYSFRTRDERVCWNYVWKNIRLNNFLQKVWLKWPDVLNDWSFNTNLFIRILQNDFYLQQTSFID